MSDAKRYVSNPDLIAKIHAASDRAIQQKFRALRAEQEARDVRYKEQKAFTEKMVRAAFGAEAPRTTSSLIGVKEVLKTLREQAEHSAFVGSPAAKAFALRPFSNIRDGVADPNFQLVGAQPDTKLEIIGPPYADQFFATGKSDNADANASANGGDGRFEFSHGAAGGSATSAAGIWVQFRPNDPLPRLIQVRPYVEFLYSYDDLSDNEYIAHNHGNFGILVNSFDLHAGDLRAELDYRYGVWSDGTSWYEEHYNPSWDGSDFDFAFVYGNEAPYFLADPDRIYMACIWCFGSLDAGSGFFGNALAAGNISARVGFVVIGQQ